MTGSLITVSKILNYLTVFSEGDFPPSSPPFFSVVRNSVDLNTFEGIQSIVFLRLSYPIFDH